MLKFNLKMGNGIINIVLFMKSQFPKFFKKLEDGSLIFNMSTNRLVIRSFNQDSSDLLDLIELQSNEEVMKFVGAGGARDEEKIKRIHSNILGIWQNGDPIGCYAICDA